MCVPRRFLEGVTKLSIQLNNDEASEQQYTVRLFFVEPTENQIGDRVFDVLIEGNKVLADLDVVKEAGSTWQTVVKEIDVKASGMLEIEFQ